MGTLGRAIYTVGFWIRETGQAVDRLGCRLQGNYYFQEHLSRHRTLMNVFDKRPTVDNEAFVAPSASLIGDVEIGRGSSIWYGCVVRERIDAKKMAATTAMSKTSHFHRNLLRYTLHQWRSCSTPSSSPHLSSHLLNSLSPHPRSLLNTVNFPSQERIFIGLYQRYLCTAAKSSGGNNAGEAAAGSESSVTESSSESNSGAEKSEGSQQSGDAGKSIRGSPVSWMSLFLLLVTGAGIVFYYDREKKRHIEEIANASNAVREGPSVGQAAIGGPFNLINHEGKNVTDKDFLGKWTVLYFGFTHCPDICPDELQKLAAAVDKIKEKSGIEIIPIFISVDPERDTVEQVSEYVKEFHPKLIGLTGDPEEIRKVARAYRVYYMKTIEEGSDYLVDHSIVMYLMSPEMKFIKFYGKNSDVDGLTNGMISEIKKYKK